MKQYLRLKKSAILAVMGVAFAFPFGSCNFDEFTVTTAVDPAGLLASVFRTAILTPIDEFVTNGINNLFDELKGEGD